MVIETCLDEPFGLGSYYLILGILIGSFLALLLDDMVVDEGGYDGDGNDVASLLNQLANLLILDPNHVLSVHLVSIVMQKKMSKQYSIKIGFIKFFLILFNF